MCAVKKIEELGVEQHTKKAPQTYIFKLYSQWKFLAKLQKHTYSLHTIHFSFQVKSPLEAVKHSQLLLFFTQIMISETSTE